MVGLHPVFLTSNVTKTHDALELFQQLVDNESDARRAPTVQEHITITRQTTALNDFTNTPYIIKGAFLTLFPIGSGLPDIKGTLPSDWLHWSFRQGSGIFTNQYRWLFFVFSQKVRHIAATEVSCRIKAGNDIWQKFSSLVNSTSFYEELDTAIRNPDSHQAKHILSLVLPMIQISGGRIPYGPIERKSTITSLYNELRWFGLPLVFATLSPYDMDNLLTMRIIKEGSSVDPYNFDFQIPSNDDRAMLIAQNPVLAADMYMRQSLAYDELLFGLSPSTTKKTTRSFHEREPGIFGKPVAERKCNEGQGKGTLHRHGIDICHITCDILARISSYPPLVKKWLVLSTQ